MQDKVRVLRVFCRRPAKQQQSGHAQFGRKESCLLCSVKADDDALASSFNRCNPSSAKPLHRGQAFPHNVFSPHPTARYQSSDNAFTKLARSYFRLR
jgi:hypothetical protein